MIFVKYKSKTSQTTSKNSQSSKNPKKQTTTTESLESKRIESTSQIEAQTSQNENTSQSQVSEAATQLQGGTGVWEATSGILDIDKEVSVYVASDKSSEIVFTKPVGSQVEWDKYSGQTHEENACNHFLATCIFSKYFHDIYTHTSIQPLFRLYYNKISWLKIYLFMKNRYLKAIFSSCVCRG
ncbi:hypothetical protein AB6M97_06715 [Streptococcus hillyeri]|uniref:Uncharacterized protein n=1 Tax=Streptococcus hillyeri TaxID=2282420 RepID=A0A3L9DWR6_9STRE|nr:hypothetical protein [Streptococcus hillyeri]RLY04708.1 hypothetical protein EAF07_01570 [Streptococcus hillyeri]